MAGASINRASFHHCFGNKTAIGKTRTVNTGVPRERSGGTRRGVQGGTRGGPPASGPSRKGTLRRGSDRHSGTPLRPIALICRYPKILLSFLPRSSTIRSVYPSTSAATPSWSPPATRSSTCPCSAYRGWSRQDLRLSHPISDEIAAKLAWLIHYQGYSELKPNGLGAYKRPSQICETDVEPRCRQFHHVTIRASTNTRRAARSAPRIDSSPARNRADVPIGWMSPYPSVANVTTLK